MITTETITQLPANDLNFVPNNISFLANEDAARYHKQFNGFIVTGGTASVSGGLSHTISAFEAFIHGYFVMQAPTLVTYTANRRTYCFVDSLESRPVEITFSGGAGATFKFRNGNLVFSECNVNSSQPTPSVSGLVPLLYADTDLIGAITVVTDLRVLSPIVSSTKIIDPAEYGLIGDDLTDNLAAAQFMFDALPQGSIVRFGQGIYRFNNTLTLTKGCSIEGVGNSLNGTVLRMTQPTVDFISKTAATPLTLSNLYIDASVARTGGAALALAGSAELDLIKNVTFNGHHTQIRVNAGRGWSIQDCNFFNAELCCIDVHNTSGAGDNDAVISNNVFAGSLLLNNQAIRVRQSQGLAIVTNRFIGYRYGIAVDPAAYCSGLSIGFNTFRDQAVNGVPVIFSRSAGTAMLQFFVITDNIIATASLVAIQIGNGTANVFLDGIIANNEIFMTTSNAVGLFLNGDSQVLIDGNNFNLPNGVSDTSVCINLTSFSSSANIALNGYKSKTFVVNAGVNSVLTPITLLASSFSFDVPSLPSATQSEIITSLPGAAVNDTIILTRPTLAQLPASILFLGCRVSATNQISIFLYNTSGSAVDPGIVTFTGTLIRPVT